MLQIKQLNITELEYITCDRQQQIYGSGAGPHDISKDAEELWTGYASGDDNAGTTTTDGDLVAEFTQTHSSDNSDHTHTVGTIALT
jgi:hypothetical protein